MKSIDFYIVSLIRKFREGQEFRNLPKYIPYVRLNLTCARLNSTFAGDSGV